MKNLIKELVVFAMAILAFLGLGLFITLLIPPSPAQIAQEIVKEQERAEFKRTHTWVSCPSMSKVNRSDTVYPLRRKGGEIWVIQNATATNGFGFNVENTKLVDPTWDKQKACEDEFTEDWEAILHFNVKEK